jgi:ATP-dependent Zn protease
LDLQEQENAFAKAVQVKHKYLSSLSGSDFVEMFVGVGASST